MITLNDALTYSPIRRILGSCNTAQDAIDKVNEATSRLIRRGDWFGTVVPIFVCVFNGCLVQPRYVQQVRKMNFCNREIPVKNGWFEFIAYNQQYCGWGRWLSSWFGNESKIVEEAVSPVFQDIQGDGRLIRAYARTQADYGKTMTFFGLDNNNQPLVTVDPSTGNTTQGITLTLQSPFASSSTFVRSISYISRQVTQQIVDVYAYNATTNLLEDIGHYDPTDTTPTYSRSKLNINWPCCSVPATTFLPNCCGVSRGVVELVKLRYIPAQALTDLVIVPNLDALKLMIMGINREEEQDRDGRLAFEKDAIEVLNRDLEDNSPDEIFSAAPNTLGPHVWSNQCW